MKRNKRWDWSMVCQSNNVKCSCSSIGCLTSSSPVTAAVAGCKSIVFVYWQTVTNEPIARSEKKLNIDWLDGYKQHWTKVIWKQHLILGHFYFVSFSIRCIGKEIIIWKKTIVTRRLRATKAKRQSDGRLLLLLLSLLNHHISRAHQQLQTNQHDYGAHNRWLLAFFTRPFAVRMVRMKINERELSLGEAVSICDIYNYRFTNYLLTESQMWFAAANAMCPEEKDGSDERMKFVYTILFFTLPSFVHHQRCARAFLFARN